MKKALILTSLFVIFTMNVDAANPIPDLPFEKACLESEITEGSRALANVSYDIQYIPDAADREGNPLDGYMKITFVNIPEGYRAEVKDDEYFTYEVFPGMNYVTVPGGVYMVEFYKNSCATVIKKMNIRIPYYKMLCGANVKCDENPWFDGTFENSASNQSRTPKNELNKILVIILVILIIITGIFVFVLIKRRRNRAKAL